MTEFYFIRHAVPENDSGSFNLAEFNKDQMGIKDHSLSDKGVGQAHIAGKKLTDMNLDLVISSTMKRASETAEIISSITSVPFQEKYDELKEFRPGGLNLEDSTFLKAMLTKNLPKPVRIKRDNFFYTFLSIYYMLQWMMGNTKNGSSLNEFYQGIDKVLLHYVKSEHQKIAVVCHGYLILLLGMRIASKNISDFLKLSLIENCSLTRIDIESDIHSISSIRMKLVYFSKSLLD